MILTAVKDNQYISVSNAKAKERYAEGYKIYNENNMELSKEKIDALDDDRRTATVTYITNERTVS